MSFPDFFLGNSLEALKSLASTVKLRKLPKNGKNACLQLASCPFEPTGKRPMTSQVPQGRGTERAASTKSLVSPKKCSQEVPPSPHNQVMLTWGFRPHCRIFWRFSKKTLAGAKKKSLRALKKTSAAFDLHGHQS